MVVGFNHNVRYKGEVYHVQTEDSGLDNPTIVTLLYKGGSILASRKTHYADILKMDNLETVVEELMQEQHKAMMRRLKSGEFDDRALSAPAAPAVAPSVAAASPSSASAAQSVEPDQPSPPPVASAPLPSSPRAAAPRNSASLDDAVTAFFGSR